jgi:hypothetical protein
MATTAWRHRVPAKDRPPATPPSGLLGHARAAGGAEAASGATSVVQRHRAGGALRRPAEMDEVLASWAVPRGPALDAPNGGDTRRDHPLEYFDFQGDPAGQYGGGDVIVGLGHLVADRGRQPGGRVGGGAALPS